MHFHFFQVLEVGLSSSDLINRQADFLRTIGHVLSSIVEFQLDSSGQPRVEEEASSDRTRRKRSLDWNDIFGMFSQNKNTVWYYTNETALSRARRATGGFSKVSCSLFSYIHIFFLKFLCILTSILLSFRN